MTNSTEIKDLSTEEKTKLYESSKTLIKELLSLSVQKLSLLMEIDAEQKILNIFNAIFHDDEAARELQLALFTKTEKEKEAIIHDINCVIAEKALLGINTLTASAVEKLNNKVTEG